MTTTASRSRLTEPWRQARALPRAVWATCAATFVNRMGTMALPFLALYLTERRGYTESHAGRVVAAYGLAGAVAAPFSGRLADRIGPATVVSSLLLLSGVMMFVVPLARGDVLLLAAVLVWGVFNEGMRPATATLVTDAAGPSKRTAMTVYRLAVNLGMSVGPAVGGFLAAVSFVALFWVDGATALAGALTFWLVRGAMPPHVHATRSPGRTALGDGRFWLRLIAQFPATVVFFQVNATLSLFVVRTLGLPTSVYGLLFAVNTAMIVICELPLTVAIRAWSYTKALCVGTAFMAGGFALMAFARTAPTLMLDIAIFTVGEMIFLPALPTSISEFAPRGRSGEYLGVYSAAIGVSMVAAPLVGTSVLEHQGATTLWLGTGVLGLLSVILFAWVPMHQRA